MDWEVVDVVDELVEGAQKPEGLVRILQRLVDGACSGTGLGSRTKTHWPVELQCKNTNQHIRSSIH